MRRARASTTSQVKKASLTVRTTRLVVLSLVSSLALVSLVFIHHSGLQNKDSNSAGDDGAPLEGLTVPPFSWNDQGCQEWTKSKKLRLTALAVTLLVPADNPALTDLMRKSICNGAIASQRQNLLIPQQWDLLLVFATEHPNDPPLMTLDEAAACLELVGSYTLQTWQNLDGTNMTTRRYMNPAYSHTVYLAATQLSYPQYIQDDLTLLDYNITPPHCKFHSSYIQGTRWYTHELLQLGILQEYDYFAKIDTDVWFLQTIPFDILWDLQLQNAMLMHSAEYPGGEGACAGEILEAVDEFKRQHHQHKQEQTESIHGEWHGQMCSEGMWQVQKAADLYYANFIIGRVDFWQSAAVRAFGEFLTNYPRGFFRYRWTDQIFFHFAMGLFLGPDFTVHVADYTDMRCAPVKNCWVEIFDYFGKHGDERKCLNGGYFLHTKKMDVEWNQTLIHDVERSSILKSRSYQSKCNEA